MFIGRFVATLSNGYEVIEKYPHEKPKPGYMGWLQLQEFIKRNKLRITDMSVSINGAKHHIKENADAYFVNMRVAGPLGIEKVFARGLGFRQGKHLFICWLDKHGRILEMEVRNV